jgi:hypothetical protein
MAISTSSPDEISHASTPELFSGLLSDVKELAAGHAGRMRGEIGDEFKNLKRMMMIVGASVGVAVVGALLIGHALAYALVAIGLPVWAGYLTATIVLVGGGLLVLVRLPASKKDADLVPEESIDKLEQDMRQIRHAVSAR